MKLSYSKGSLAKVSTLRYGVRMTTFPRFEMPDFKLPEFTLPSFDLPEVELPSAEQVAAFARDAAYAGVGLVVMTVERVRELNEQLLELFTTQLDETPA